MGMTAGGCRDLRKLQDDGKVADAFSKLVSGGKFGYKTVIEKKKDEPHCSKCHVKLAGNEKFCPECGEKTEWQKAAEVPIVLLSCEELEQKFKKGEEKESEILAYMRDMLKIPDVTAFELLNRWRKEMQAPVQETKIDLNQFKG
jgi:hypothetical protein